MTGHDQALDAEDCGPTSHEEHLHAIGLLKHEPIRPPRKGHLGEEVYSTAWRLLMEREGDPYNPPNWPLHEMIGAIPEFMTQRHATVAASFVNWLGTNCGLSFMLQARRLCEGKGNKQREWLGQWAWDNRRETWMNNGIRTIEHILAPEDHFGRVFPIGYGVVRIPELSASDYEVVERVVAWLATDEGDKFYLACQAEIDERQRAEWLPRSLAASRQPTTESK